MAWPITARNETEIQMRFELFRFLTFMTFPLNANVSGLTLAGRGFFYTGIGVLVRCFSCHSNWQTDRVMFGNSMHEADCAFMLGTDTQNVPMHPHSGHDQQEANRNRLLSPIGHGSRYINDQMAGMLFPTIFALSLLQLLKK
ncbi:hypothetical protein DPMN_184313 [Dreissena polymorpha]|uniref:Uncharacterized protein n=1 Tax=Dreissena polymorpha TaxID=45954 RepID=A0A9D4I697_DREPO|nr:hypothetical protein DPMN_184313 [Dreissena polymorpha]